MGRVHLLHEELTYVIRGILYTVHNHLGSYRNEKQYSDAIEYGLQVKDISYEREKVLKQSFSGEKKGRNRVDFLVADKVIIEVKAVNSVSKQDYYQCLRYLVSSGKDLCLLVNFRPKSVHIKRILNPNSLKENP